MCNLRKTVLVLIALVYSLFSGQGGAAAQSAVREISEVAARSDLIVHVRAETSNSSWSSVSAGKEIITTTSFRVIEPIVSNGKLPDTFRLEQRGGTIGDTSQYVSTAVLFNPGEECLLFMQQATMQITEGPKGKAILKGERISFENYELPSAGFINAVRESKNKPAILEKFLRNSIPDSYSITPPVTGGKLKSSSTATTSIYTIDGQINDFVGGTDANSDNFYETFTFNIGISGSINPGPDTVYYKIVCPTTGQSWISDNYFILPDTMSEQTNFSFDETVFAGLFAVNTNLDFTVQMWDQTQSILLAEDPVIENEPVKIGIPIPSEVVIYSISPDKASAGTNTTVTITGTGFGSLQGNGKVEFFYKAGHPEIVAPVVSWSDTQVVCYVPIGYVYGYPGSTGSGPVKVNSASGLISNGFPFRVTFGYGGNKWAGTSTGYYINENLNTLTSEGQAIIDAAETWNSLNANFRFLYAGTHSNTTTVTNGKNEILWGTLSTSALAESTLWTVGGFIVECDIMFNVLHNWTTTPGSSPQSIDIQSIAVHELGHWLNLRDLYGTLDASYDVSKIMYGSGQYNQAKRDLQTDDIAGIYWIYGLLPTYSVSGYIKTSASVPVAGVTVAGLPGNPVTNANGFYAAQVGAGWTGTFTPVKTAWYFSPVSLTLNTVTSNRPNQNFTGYALNSDATLSDIRVNGNSIPGFNKNQVSYSIQLPFGTTPVPIVTATPSQPTSSVTIIQAAAIPGIATLQVTAENTTTRLTYTVAFTLGPPSTDAALSDLRVGGTTIAEFSPDITSYSVVLPYGTAIAPAIAATTRFAGASSVITPPPVLPGSAIVEVIAQDGLTRRTYSVNFSLLKNSDATLSGLSVSGEAIPGFQHNILNYNIALPYGTVMVPDVTAQATDPNAAILITPAISLPGQTTVKVTADNGTEFIIYTVSFSLLPPSADAALEDLKVNGVTLSGFDPARTLYDVVLPHGTSDVPVLSFTTRHTRATAIQYPTLTLPGYSSIVVTAQDGLSKTTYTVSFLIAKNYDATLADLSFAGLTLPGFSASRLEYMVRLPFGTTEVPIISARTNDPNSTMVITPAAALPGNTRVKVTAEDGVTTITYVVNFTIETPSADATLASIFVAGHIIAEFTPSRTSYSVTLPYGTTEVPNVAADPANQSATVVVTSAATIPGTTMVVVTAQDGVTKMAYMVNFILAKNNDASLFAVNIGGNELSGFDPAVLFYHYPVLPVTLSAPVTNATPSDPKATVTVIQAASIPDTARIQVVAEDGITRSTYEVLIRYALAGTDDLTRNTSLRAFPNPVNDQLTVKWELPSPDQALISLTDLTGRLMLVRRIVTSASPHTEVFDLSAFDAGVYLLRAVDATRSFTLRILKE
jgi:hypothetical protein